MLSSKPLYYWPYWKEILEPCSVNAEEKKNFSGITLESIKSPSFYTNKYWLTIITNLSLLHITNKGRRFDKLPDIYGFATNKEECCTFSSQS
jgi:hypothetical protein